MPRRASANTGCCASVREPEGGLYKVDHVLERGEHIRPLLSQGAAIAVNDLLGPG